MALVRGSRGDWPDVVRRWARSPFFPEWDGDWLRVEEFRDGDTWVVRADLPGIDPDKDVELSVADGILHVAAQREESSEHKGKDSYRSEFRYGSFTRNIALPEGADENTVNATYRDGVLEVRLPVAKETKSRAVKIPISRSGAS